MVFSTPHDEFCISGDDIWGEGTSDRYLQAPQNAFDHITHMWSTRVDQSGPKAKIRVFKQFSRQK